MEAWQEHGSSPVLLEDITTDNTGPSSTPAAQVRPTQDTQCLRLASSGHLGSFGRSGSNNSGSVSGVFPGRAAVLVRASSLKRAQVERRQLAHSFTGEDLI